MLISLRRKIAQMLIIGFSGLALQDDSPVVAWLRRDGLGGVLLFDVDLQANRACKNLKDTAQIQQLTHDLNRYAHMADPSQPLLIAVDYEGGVVDRLANVFGCMKTISPIEQADLSEPEFAAEMHRMASTLSRLGFNLNFAPVVDLHFNHQTGIIGRLGRSFSDDPVVVSKKAGAVVQAFREHGIVCAYKHFPGHGSAIGDTHEAFVDVTNTHQLSELKPYAALNCSTKAADGDWPLMVMTAHVVHRGLDNSGLPATLSYSMLTELLRHQLAFDGVIVSDDLQMHAISHHFSLDDALALTINAGADMLIFGNQWGNVSATELVDRIEELVFSGRIAESRINAAYKRICSLKKVLQLR